MRQDTDSLGQSSEIKTNQRSVSDAHKEDFVLEKSIFNNVFEKDIRRVYIYKKAERLAKAIHLIAPAFVESVTLRNRIDAVGIGLIDAAILPPGVAHNALSRELLALSSVLAIARTNGFLSAMNADLISREAHLLLQEVAEYEEPRLFLDDAPSLAMLAKSVHQQPERSVSVAKKIVRTRAATTRSAGAANVIKDKLAVKDSSVSDRREAIMTVIKNKPKASIKDISTVIRSVSEKTIQRELISLIDLGLVSKEGERRWSTYSLVS